MSIGDMLWEGVHFYEGCCCGRTRIEDFLYREVVKKVKLSKIYRRYPNYDELPEGERKRVMNDIDGSIKDLRVEKIGGEVKIKGIARAVYNPVRGPSKEQFREEFEITVKQ